MLSNAIPAALALVAVDRTLGRMSPLAIEVLFAQKVFVEVAGHYGLSETTWTAFPLCRLVTPRAWHVAIRSTMAKKNVTVVFLVLFSVLGY